MVLSNKTGGLKAVSFDLEGGNRLRNVYVLLKYIERIQQENGLTDYKFCKENSLSGSYVTNLRRLLNSNPSAFPAKLSFGMIVNLSLRYGIPFLASDYLDTSGSYPNNYLPNKAESKPNKQPKNPAKAPPKPKFI